MNHPGGFEIPSAIKRLFTGPPSGLNSALNTMEPYRTTSMFTEIEGEWDEVMAVVRDATMRLADQGIRTEVILKADIRPGHSDTLHTKVEKMEALLTE